MGQCTQTGWIEKQLAKSYHLGQAGCSKQVHTHCKPKASQEWHIHIDHRCIHRIWEELLLIHLHFKQKGAQYMSSSYHCTWSSLSPRKLPCRNLGKTIMALVVALFGVDVDGTDGPMTKKRSSSVGFWSSLGSASSCSTLGHFSPHLLMPSLR
jgi:hypothetical protein